MQKEIAPRLLDLKSAAKFLTNAKDKGKDETMNSNKFSELVELIRDRIDIVEVIGSRIELNNQNMAICPFHDDHNPSFSVNAEEQYFNCFGCEAGGDVFKFLELYEKKSFLEVLRECGRQVGVEMPMISGEESALVAQRRALEDVLEETVRFYERNLSEEVVKYLVEERGLTDEIIRRFRIGFASGYLADHLINKCKISKKLCMEAGVLRRADGGSLREYFQGRIVLPFIRHGRIVSLTGRALVDEEKKYLNLPGPLPGIYNEPALRHKEVIVAEGIFDCLSAVQVGFNAVSLHGLGFKQEYVQRFKRCDTAYLCLDGDNRGREAAKKIGELLGEKARIVDLPDGQDPNDYLREHSKDDLQELLDAGKTPLELELECIPTDISKIELSKRLNPLLRRIAQLDEPTAEAWLSQEIKIRYGLTCNDINAYRKKMRKYQQTSCGLSVSEDARDGIEINAIFDGLVDVVEHKGEPAFLIKDGEDLKIVEKAEVDGKIYQPPARGSIPWLLARGEKVIEFYQASKKLRSEADAALYDAVRDYHKGISELPDEGFYDILTSWVLHTYLIESFRYTPIICLFAVAERGKSRTGKGMIYVARRGIHVESLREAYLVRIAEAWRAAVFFDVRDIWKRALKLGSDDVLLQRFETGLYVPRVNRPELGPFEAIDFYSTFGPTIIATNEAIHEILESRTVMINMQETDKSFEDDVIPENALELKERLLAFRAQYMGEKLPETKKPDRGRLGDIMKPLLQTIKLVRPDRESEFHRMVKKLRDEKEIEKSTSLDGQLLKIMLDLKDKVEYGILPVMSITNEYNEDKSEKMKISAQRVGRRLTALGFRKARTGQNTAAYVWDEDKIEKMCVSYGLKQPLETPETPVDDSDGAEVRDDTD